jgi:hypothetical protein
MAAEAKRYSRFADFYPFYLGEHSNRTCRRLHFIGTTVGILFLAHAVSTLNFWWLLAGIVQGYAWAWFGHYVFEKNRPATFTYPVYSLMGDWVMWKEIFSGKIRF